MNRRSLVFSFSFFLVATASPQAQQGGLEDLRQMGKAFASVARAVSPSVVFIQVETSAKSPSSPAPPIPFEDFWPFGDDSFERFFGDKLPRMPRTEPRRGERRATGQGSGFAFATDSGHIADKTYLLTNNHVVEGAERIRVRFQDGREVDAEIKGRDPQSDVAVIEVPATNIPPLPLGDSSKLEVGEWVVAIGNPFGLSHTLTVGVVSATGRTTLGINDYEDFIQTDAAINPGNSGGPLVNLSGEVVGMNTAIFSQSGGHMGVGFAIPINLAKTIARQLIETGAVTRGYLGIVIQQLTSDLAESFDLERAQGILVSQVSKDSPAARAGVQQGDVIIAYEGKPVKNLGAFRNRVALTPPGSEGTLKIIRDEREMEIRVSIGTLTEHKLAAAQGSPQSSAELGLTVQTITPDLAESFGIKEEPGVVVSEVISGSVAATAGIEVGTVILRVNREPVSSAREFRKALAKSAEERRVLLLIRQQGIQRFVALSW